MLQVERALVSGLVTQRIADLHEKTAGKHSVLMLPSAILHIWHALFNCVKIMPNWEMVIVSVMFLILSKMFFAWHSSSPSSVAGAQWPSTVSCQNNKTQCQLCKRLTGRIIPFVNCHFPVYKAIFGLVTPYKQPGDPRAILLLTTEKEVFCNFWHLWG